jgi:hypothetical protein
MIYPAFYVSLPAVIHKNHYADAKFRLKMVNYAFTIKSADGGRHQVINIVINIVTIWTAVFYMFFNIRCKFNLTARNIAVTSVFTNECDRKKVLPIFPQVIHTRLQLFAPA